MLVHVCVWQDEVWICMELMATCLEKLMKRLKEPIPECILGKVAVAVRVLLFSSILARRSTVAVSMICDHRSFARLNNPKAWWQTLHYYQSHSAAWYVVRGTWYVVIFKCLGSQSDAPVTLWWILFRIRSRHMPQEACECGRNWRQQIVISLTVAVVTVCL